MTKMEKPEIIIKIYFRPKHRYKFYIVTDSPESQSQHETNNLMNAEKEFKFAYKYYQKYLENGKRGS